MADDADPAVAAAAVVTVGAGPAQIAMVPDNRHIFFDQVGPNHYVLTSTLTYEKADLHGNWEIAFDEDGDAVITKTDPDAEPTEFETVDLLVQREVRVGDDPQLHLGRKGSTVLTPFETLMLPRRQATVQLANPMFDGSQQFTLWVFRRRRAGGSFVWWQMDELYSKFKLDTYQG